MGVSSSGKSTLAALLANRLGWSFIDGDDLHPPANVEKMRHGIPLDDHDRQPWLEAICDAIAQWRAAATSGVIACSALRSSYRATLRAGHQDVWFVYLRITPDQAARRQAGRRGHFMPPQLLHSQFAALEDPSGEAQTISLDAALQPDAMVEAAIKALSLDPASPPSPESFSA